MNTSRQHCDFDSLALRMAANDEVAYDEFGRQFGPRLWAYFQRLGLSAADAESLAVTCITEAAMKVVQYSPREEGSFTGWVYKIAYHILVDWKRQRSRATNLTNPEAIVAPHLDSVDSDITERTRNVCEAVYEALAQLSELDRKIVELRDFELSHSYEEIGEIMGITAGAARVRHHRAYKKLEQKLSRYPAIQSRFGLNDTAHRLDEDKQNA